MYSVNEKERMHMVMSGTNSTLKEKERLIKDITLWNRGNDKVLNIITVPYNKSDVFEEIIFKYLKEERKVLYISNDDEGTKDLIDLLKSKNFRNYNCVLENLKRLNEGKPLIITTYDNALTMQESYDLVIYDDDSSFSKYSRFEILDLLSTFYKTSSRIICRSIECIFQNAPCIEMPLCEKGMPIIEPRIITTRLDLTREIPSVIYDYLKWSIKSSRNVVIFTPGEEISERVREYLMNIKETLLTNILMYSDVREKEVKYFLEKRKGIVVTHNIDIMKMNLSHTDFIVYIAEDRIFEYKKLVNICSKASNVDENTSGEVILLSNDISRDMENCRDIIRRFNKQIWDLGLIGV